MAYFPVGGKWTIYANGLMGELNIRLEDGHRFTGTVFGDPINGVYKEGLLKVSFTRGGAATQIYQGYLAFPVDSTPENATYTMAGTFDDLAGTYGWFAQRYIIP